MREAANPTVAIIGAGIGGLMTAIALKEKLGFHDFIVYERENEVGGTWRANTYPGASSDVSSHLYSYSKDLNPEWSHSHALQSDIHSYWLCLAQKYNLRMHIVLNTSVMSASWIHPEQRYKYICENHLTGERTEKTARVLVSAIGFVDMPKFPDAPGLESFKGVSFHSSRWIDMNMSGKRVGVVGNGASAVQFMSKLTEDPTVNVAQFCRTPVWLMPPIRAPYPTYVKWLFRHIPFATRLFRNFMFFRTELKYYNVFVNQTIRKLIVKVSTNHILNNSPPRYHEKMIPKYDFGCKRIVFDTGYLNSLHRPNVFINWDGIDKIVPEGILTKVGEFLPFDILVFATGFQSNKYPIPITGTSSRTLQDYYDAHGGPTAYLGTVVPEFPNFFILSGPNTGTGYMSVVFFEEVQLDYILPQLRFLLDPASAKLSLNIKECATKEYDDKIQLRLNNSIYSDCSSWYRAGGNGKISTIFPGPVILFWWWAKNIDWGHYQVLDFTGKARDADIIIPKQRNCWVDFGVNPYFHSVLAIIASATFAILYGTLMARESKALIN